MSGGLVVTGVEVARGGRTIVSAAGLSAPVGSVTGIVGPNGAGKSTLLGAVVGLHRLAAGTIEFDGVELPRMNRGARARLCALVEQSASSDERLTVLDVVGLGRIPYNSVWSVGPDDERIVYEALQQVGMTDFSSRLMETLSGGEQQRVHVARALAQQPRLMVLDEPTSHLDIRAQLQVLHLLRRFARSGGTVLLALHDLNLALRFCDRLVVMKEGSVVTEDAPHLVLTESLLASVYDVQASIIAGPEGPIIAYGSEL